MAPITCNTWGVAMEGRRLYWEEEDGGASLDVREPMECMETCLGLGEVPTESLWVRIKDKPDEGDTVVGGKYWCSG